MNVLIVVPELSYRGGERIFYTLAKGLVKKGHSVSLLAARVRGDAFVIEPPIKLISTPIWLNNLLQNNLIFLLLQLPILFSLIFLSSKHVDIIHTESGFSLWASILAGRLRSTHVVWMIFAFETEPVKRRSFNSIFSLTFRRIDKFFARLADAYTCIAPRIPKALRKYYAIAGVKVTIPAIDTDRFRGAKESLVIRKHKLSGKRILLQPATLHPKKNQDLAINSMLKVVKKFPETVLIFLGDGPDKDRLKKMVEEKDLEENIIFSGVAKGDSIKHFYAAADLVLVTSKVENEGLSMTSLEALAVGKLPIVTWGAGVAEIINRKKIGIVVKPTVETFSNAIISYLREPVKYEKMTRRGRTWVKKELTLEKFAKETLEVYEKCLI